MCYISIYLYLCVLIQIWLKRLVHDLLLCLFASLASQRCLHICNVELWITSGTMFRGIVKSTYIPSWKGSAGLFTGSVIKIDFCQMEEWWMVRERLVALVEEEPASSAHSKHSTPAWKATFDFCYTDECQLPVGVSRKRQMKAAA